MKGWILAGLFFAGYIAQTTLLDSASVWGVRPDLILILVAAVGMSYGPWAGAAAGLLVGLFADFAGGRLVGLGAASKMAAGAAAGWMGRRVFRENAFGMVSIILLVSTVEHVLYLGGAKAFGVGFPLGESLLRIVVPGVWCDAVAALILYPALSGWIRLPGGSRPEAPVDPIEG